MPAFTVNWLLKGSREWFVNWIDIIFILALGTGAAVGLVAGLMRVWVPFAFLMAGMGFAGGLVFAIVPEVFGSVENEARRELAVFGLAFIAFLALGALITGISWRALSFVSTLLDVVPMGILINRAGGILLGAFSSLIFLSVIMLSLQLYPYSRVAKAIDDSSFAGKAFAFVERFTTTMDFTPAQDD